MILLSLLSLYATTVEAPYGPEQCGFPPSMQAKMMQVFGSKVRSSFEYKLVIRGLSGIVERTEKFLNRLEESERNADWPFVTARRALLQCASETLNALEKVVSKEKLDPAEVWHFYQYCFELRKTLDSIQCPAKVYFPEFMSILNNLTGELEVQYDILKDGQVVDMGADNLLYPRGDS